LSDSATAAERWTVAFGGLNTFDTRSRRDIATRTVCGDAQSRSDRRSGVRPGPVHRQRELRLQQCHRVGGHGGHTDQRHHHSGRVVEPPGCGPRGL
jgi:hypothetical protein